MLLLFFRFKLTATFLMLLTALLTVTPAAAQSNTLVFLQPVTESGDTVIVDVIAQNVTELYGVEFQLVYDPAAVEIVDVRPDQDGVQINAGTLLPADQGFVVANQAAPEKGTISFAMTLLNPAPAVSGSGSLAQISLKKLQNTPTTIDIADVKLVAISLQIIPAQTSGLTLNAAENSATGLSPAAPAETQASTFPWWIVAVGIIVLGLITLGAFLALGNLSGAKSPPAPAATPAQRPTGSRPSAFKKP